jgi:hypothetical protein
MQDADMAQDDREALKNIRDDRRRCQRTSLTPEE